MIRYRVIYKKGMYSIEEYRRGMFTCDWKPVTWFSRKDLADGGGTFKSISLFPEYSYGEVYSSGDKSEVAEVVKLLTEQHVGITYIEEKNGL